MPELTNSKRVLYKATHVAVRPDPSNSGDTRAALMVKGGVAMGAMARSLNLQKSEVAPLRKALQEAAAATPEKGAGLQRAVSAAHLIAQDTSIGAAFRHAEKFRKVKPADLAATAAALASLRRENQEKVRTLVERIRSAHLAHLDSQAKAQAAAAPTPAAVRAARKASAAAIRLFGPSMAANPAFRKLAASQPGTAVHAIIPPTPSRPPVPQKVDATLEASLEWARLNKKADYQKLVNVVAPTTLLTPSMPNQPQFLTGEIANNYAAPIPPSLLAGAFSQFIPLEPVGRLFLERIETTPVGIERGELVHSIPLTAKESVNISHREWSQQTDGFEKVVEDFLEGYSEKGVAEKADVIRATASESKHATALNVGASLSASYASVTLSSSFGYSATSDDSQSLKDSRQHTSFSTSKAAARTRKDHKVTFKVASAVETEDLAVRTIVNESTGPVRVDYYRMMRKWKVDLIRFGLRMTYDIVIPSPGAALLKKLHDLRAVDDALNAPLNFGLTTESISRDNWVNLGSQWGTALEPPPDDTKTIDVMKPFERQDPGAKTYDFLTIDVDSDYTLESGTFGASYQAENTPQKPSVPTDGSNSWFDVPTFITPGPSVGWGGYGGTLDTLIGKTGIVNITFMTMRIKNGLVQVVATLRLKEEAFKIWQSRALTALRDAAVERDQLNRNRLRDRKKQLEDEIAGLNGLTLRQMEREEIMKGVLKWLFGPEFDLVPGDLLNVFTTPADPTLPKVLEPKDMDPANWQKVMEYGEFIKYIHNAIEWENVLYVMYPYFWDTPANWDFKLFLNHADPQHRMFLRAGAARVVLTIREGFEDGFTELMERGATGALPYANTPSHPYRKISDEIRSFAQTNYPGIPPANPATNVRPMLFPEQVHTWNDMSFVIELLQRYFDANGAYPTTAQGLAQLTTQLKSGEVLPKNDFWGNPFVYRSPGETGNYDLISYGADGKADTTLGLRDKNADISANAEGTVIATWFEYTPTSALDVAMTSTLTDMA